MGSLLFLYSLLCFMLLSQSFSFSFVHHLCSPSESFALLQCRQPFISCDPSSLIAMSWNESADCCNWDGVTCDMLTGYVIGLDLSDSHLCAMSIHPNSSLFQLHHLHVLNLAYNDFGGSSIPNGIGQLRNLRHLNLSNSNFYGIIPKEISYLSNLVSLDLSGEFTLDQRTFEILLKNFINLEVVSFSNVDISSPIPMNMSSSLRYVDLVDTNLRGALTESFFLLPNLEKLKLRGNDLLKGVLPKIYPSNTLLELDISYTGISGELPDSIGNLSSLSHLRLDGCHFSDLIPDSIGNLTQIRELILSYNHFTSHIPPTISKLEQLTFLDLSSNFLIDEIPNVFSNLQELVELYLFNNSFIGPFPSLILSLRNLQSLDLSSNSLSGPLPSNTSILQKLIEVDLSHNSLNGTIPSWVFGLPLLPQLKLDHNTFSGVVDDIKTNIALEVLDLSHNQLNGPVLQSLAKLINLVILNLSSNIITGDIEIEGLMAIERLKSLDLSYNPLSLKSSINGSNITFPCLTYLLLSSCELKDFPQFLRNSKKLEFLDLSNNKIHGRIPVWFSNMKWDSLLLLNLSRNSLIDHLDQLNYRNLVSLDLKFNFLQGPLPSSVCNLSSLQFLDVSHNNFSNSVPHCLGSMAQLSVLDLRRNNFSGSLPPLCAQSTFLRTIALNGNIFEGPVPKSFKNCDALQVLDIGNNAINDTFPVWVGNLKDLQVLVLRANKFHGPISTFQTNLSFPMLRIFDLSDNEFSGLLPAKLFENFRAMIKLDGADKGDVRYMEPYLTYSNIVYEDSVRLVIKGHDIELEKIATILTAIDLSNNHFEGVIPKAITNLGSLWLLNLSHNNLRGDLSMGLGKMNMLEVLDLSWNRLTGMIPTELTRVKFLAVLNLSQNHLVGPIPHGSQFNTFENDSYGGNLDLCGPPLSKQCGMSDPSHVPQPVESEEEEEDESYFFSGFTWDSVVIGYRFGLIVGTVMWNLMVKVGKPKRFVEFFEGIIPNKRRRPKKRNNIRRL